MLKPRLDWLLAFVPVTIALELVTPDRATLVFASACVAIVPIAGWMGRATEHLAERTGEGVGGLLNATFGNAAEMVIALMALRQGLLDVVKASITGSIIGNMLLVLGAALAAGGVRFPSQRFNVTAARSQATMAMLAAAALVAPATYHHVAGAGAGGAERSLSVEISVVLLATYLCGLLFALRTHKQLFVGHSGESAAAEEKGHHQPWTIGRSLAVLGGATALVAWMSEILIGSVEHAAQAFGMSNVFVGVVIVAVVGNAAEHSTAILVAMRNRMDLALGVAIGSSIQVALFVAPVLVFASHWIGPRPMDLVFSPAEVLAVVLCVILTAQIAGDGESNWLEGVQLLAMYAILALLFYFLPPTP
jgi:Ca2+:H+ antiporter